MRLLGQVMRVPDQEGCVFDDHRHIEGDVLNFSKKSMLQTMLHNLAHLISYFQH